MADRRPIRLVLTEDRDLTAVPPGGAGKKIFKDVDESFRQSLASDLDSIEKRFSTQLTTQNLPVVATATLEGDALAKSYRPETLFNARTCPIIGSDAIGSLRLSVTNDGLRSLRRQVMQGKTQNIEADLSTLIEIRPFEPSIVPIVATKLINPEKRGRPFKLKIFNHHELLLLADLVLTMTRSHRDAILAKYPEASDRVFTLRIDGGDIADPVGAPNEVYEACANQIDSQLAIWAERLRAQWLQSDPS